jgi:hypothetical protein
MTRRRMLGPLRGYGVLLALVCGACAAGLPIDRLRDTTLSVESLGSVYLIDASGEHATPVLERKQTRARSDQLAQLFDEYYEPSLSPDGAYVACVRLGNNAHWGDLVEPQPLQSSEIMIARVSDRSERVIMSVPRRAPAWNILAPVWSVEGDQIFFAVDRRVWSYALAGARLDPLVELPTRYFGGFTWDHGRGEYSARFLEWNSTVRPSQARDWPRPVERRHRRDRSDERSAQSVVVRHAQYRVQYRGRPAAPAADRRRCRAGIVWIERISGVRAAPL